MFFIRLLCYIFVFITSALLIYIFSLLVQNALEVYVCEILIDAVKHSFLAKFNEIKPVAYSDFLEDLCRQVIFFPSYYDSLIYYLMHSKN